MIHGVVAEQLREPDASPRSHDERTKSLSALSRAHQILWPANVGEASMSSLEQMLRGQRATALVVGKDLVDLRPSDVLVEQHDRLGLSYRRSETAIVHMVGDE